MTRAHFFVRLVWVGILIFVLGATARADEVRVPNLLLVDDSADPLRVGEDRGAVFAIRYLAPAAAIASIADGFVRPVETVLLPDRRLYVLDEAADPLGLGRETGAVFLVNPSDVLRQAVAEPVLSSALFFNPTDLAVDDFGRILVLDADSDPFGLGTRPGGLFRGDPETGNFDVIASTSAFRQPISMALDSDGSYVILDRLADPLGQGGIPGAVFRVDANSGDVAVVKAFGPDDPVVTPESIILLPDGDYAIADPEADPSGFEDGNGAVFRLDRESGALTTLLDDPLFVDPIDLTLGEEGQLWVLDRTANPDNSPLTTGALFQFNLPTRLRTFIYNPPSTANPRSLSFAGGPDVDDSTVEWVDETPGAVERGNVLTVRATIRSNGTEPPLGVTLSDTLDAGLNFIAGTDSTGTGTFSYDPTNRILRWKGDLDLFGEETVRYQLRVARDVEVGQDIEDRVYIGVDPIFEEFTFESEVGESFTPGTIVFVDQTRLSDGDNGIIYAVNPEDTAPTLIHLGAPLVQPVDTAFLEDGRLAILDAGAEPEPGFGEGAIFLYDRSSADFQLLWSKEIDDAPVDPVGISLSADGGLLLVDREANPFELDYEPDILSRDFGPGAVFSVSMTDGTLTTVFSDARMREPLDVAVAPDGVIVAVDVKGTDGIGDLWEFDPVEEVLSRRALRDNWFRDPTGLAIDAEGTAYITDPTFFEDENEDPVIDNGGVFQVVRGEETFYGITSRNALLVDPADVFLAENKVLYVTDRDANPLRLDVTNPGAVFRIDLETGGFSIAAASPGVRRPDGPSGLSAAAPVLSTVSLVGGAVNVSIGDTLTYSLRVFNPSTQAVPELYLDLEFSEGLEYLTGSAEFGQLLSAPDIRRATWLGRLDSGDTLSVAGSVRVREGIGFGGDVFVRATAEGGGALIEREGRRRVAAPFRAGTLILSDESADPTDIGIGAGTIFSVGGRSQDAEVTLTGFPIEDPAALELTGDGDLLIADRLGSDPGRVFRLQTSTGSVTPLVGSDAGLLTPVDLFWSPAGDLYILDRDGDSDPDADGKGMIYRLPGGEGEVEVFSEQSDFRFLSEGIFSGSGRLFVTDRQADVGGVGGNTATIFELNTSTGAIVDAWQFPEIREPTGITELADGTLVITDFVAIQQGGNGSGGLFTFDPDVGTIETYLAAGSFRRPYRTYPQNGGSLLILDQAASSSGQTGSPGLVFEYNPVGRTVTEYAISDSFSVLSDLAQLPASLLDFTSYEVVDEDGGALMPSDQLDISVRLENIGTAAGAMTFVDSLDAAVVLLPETVNADLGEVDLDDGIVRWTGSIGSGEVVNLTYSVQLDPIRSRGQLLEFRPQASGPVAGTIEREFKVATFVAVDLGHFYVVDSDADPYETRRSPGAVLKVQQQTGTTTPYLSDPTWRRPVGIAALGDGTPNLYVVDQVVFPEGGGRGALYEIDPSDQSWRVAVADSTWGQLEVVNAYDSGSLILVDSWADPFEFDPQIGPGALYRVEPTSGTSTVLMSDTTWVRLRDIAQSPVTGRWLLLDSDVELNGEEGGRGAVYSIDFEAESMELMATSEFWETPVAIDVAPNGTVYVLDQTATPSGGGVGSLWSFREEIGATPQLAAVNNAFARPHDVFLVGDGQVIIVDGQATPGDPSLTRGAIFAEIGGLFLPFAATTAMLEPRRITLVGDVTPIVDVGLQVSEDERGVRVRWRGFSDRSDTRYLIYRRQVEGPGGEEELDLEDFELLPVAERFVGPGDYDFVDETVEAGAWYAYLIVVLSSDGHFDNSRPQTARSGLAPLRFELRPSLPNPFAAKATLSFSIPRTGAVRLEVFDVSGRRVRTLLDSEVEAGIHVAEWDGRSNRGHSVSSGIYFARLRWDGREAAERLVRIR